MVGPLGDLRPDDGVVLDPEQLLARPVGIHELGQHAPGELRAYPALAEPDAEVDLLGPEVLGPHLPVHLVQVGQPARPAVGGRVQAGRPLRGRVAAVGDPQVHLGIGHPDAGQRHRQVGGERLALLPGHELVRDRRHPEVGPGVGLGQQDPVVEVPDRQSASLGSLGHRTARPLPGPVKAATSTPAMAV